MPHRQPLSAQARALPCRIKKAASSDWLLAGKTIYFFTVLLTGGGSKLRAAFYGVIGNCRLLILRPALVGLVLALASSSASANRTLAFSGKLSSSEE